jgi:Flp pilus assembly protein protease CpaA
MILSAVVDERTRKVPNNLTVTAFFAALVIAVLFGKRGLWPSLAGEIDSSLGTAGVTFLFACVMFSCRLIGGGCAKMQTAFAAWLGCALPFARALLSSLTVLALALLAYVVDEFAARYILSATEDGRPRHARISQGWIAFLNVAAVLTLDWMGFV